MAPENIHPKVPISKDDCIIIIRRALMEAGAYPSLFVVDCLINSIMLGASGTMPFEGIVQFYRCSGYIHLALDKYKGSRFSMPSTAYAVLAITLSYLGESRYNVKL